MIQDVCMARIVPWDLHLGGVACIVVNNMKWPVLVLYLFVPQCSMWCLLALLVGAWLIVDVFKETR